MHLYGSGDTEVSKTVNISAQENRPLNLTVAEFTAENKLKYTIETVQNGKEYRIKFTSIPGIRENFRGILKLKTNYPEKPEITLILNGRFKSSAVAAPSSQAGIGRKVSNRVEKSQRLPIFVSSRYIRLYGKAGANIAKSVDIRAESKRSLELTTTEFDLRDKVNYSIETLEKGQKYRIKFSTVPGENHNFNGILKMKTNYPEMPLITFVIHGRFTEP